MKIQRNSTRKVYEVVVIKGSESYRRFFCNTLDSATFWANWCKRQDQSVRVEIEATEIITTTKKKYDDERIRKHIIDNPNLSYAELAENLGCSASTVGRIARQIGFQERSSLRGRKPRGRWLPSEEKFLQTNFSSDKKKIEEIAIALNRTSEAVYTKAYLLGLHHQRPGKNYLFWHEEELALLNQMSADGATVFRIFNALKELATKNKWRVHSYQAVLRKMTDQSLKPIYYDENTFLTAAVLAEGLSCSRSVIHRWFNSYKDILKPIPLQAPAVSHGVRIKNFRNFAKHYPGEIARCKPDILWLLSILA